MWEPKPFTDTQFTFCVHTCPGKKAIYYRNFLQSLHFILSWYAFIKINKLCPKILGIPCPHILILFPSILNCYIINLNLVKSLLLNDFCTPKPNFQLPTK